MADASNQVQLACIKCGSTLDNASECRACSPLRSSPREANIARGGEIYIPNYGGIGIGTMPSCEPPAARPSTGLGIIANGTRMPSIQTKLAERTSLPVEDNCQGTGAVPTPPGQPIGAAPSPSSSDSIDSMLRVLKDRVNSLAVECERDLARNVYAPLGQSFTAPSSMGHNFRTDSTWKPGMRMALESSSVDGDLHRTRSGYTLPDQLSDAAPLMESRIPSDASRRPGAHVGLYESIPPSGEGDEARQTTTPGLQGKVRTESSIDRTEEQPGTTMGGPYSTPQPDIVYVPLWPFILFVPLAVVYPVQLHAAIQFFVVCIMATFTLASHLGKAAFWVSRLCTNILWRVVSLCTHLLWRIVSGLPNFVVYISNSLLPGYSAYGNAGTVRCIVQSFIIAKLLWAEIGEGTAHLSQRVRHVVAGIRDTTAFNVFVIVLTLGFVIPNIALYMKQPGFGDL